MKLSGHTTPFAVLGHPIGHTLSPAMHNASLNTLGMDAIYLAFDVDPARLIEVLEAMRHMGFGGVNLTVPLKEAAYRGIPRLDESASRLGAVNTVEYTPDGLRGHNTDGAGFLAALRDAFDTEVKGMSVFVLGCGGAGRAIAITCACEGAGRVALSDMDNSRADAVAAEIAAMGGATPALDVAARPDNWRDACREADLIVQATPVGMKPGDRPLLEADAFRPGQIVYDLIYMYPETAFMKAARAGGAGAANGLGMLMHQGARSFKIWTGRDADTAAMTQALEKEVYGEGAEVKGRA